MIPRTRAPDARISMEGDRIVSSAETFETFAMHYGNVLQKHKRKIRNHVISNPPRRSSRLLEKMLKRQQTPSWNLGKKVRRSYSAVSENDPEALIPVMSLSELKTKRKHELKSSEDYTPAPIQKRRRATMSFCESEGSPIDSTVVKSDTETKISSSLEEQPIRQSIILIRQDFKKNLVRRPIQTDDRSSNWGIFNVVDEASDDGRLGEEDRGSDDEHSGDRRSDDDLSTTSERRSDDEDEKSDDGLFDNRRWDDRTMSRSTTLSVPSHEDSGMSTTEYSDNIQGLYPQDIVCLDTTEDDADIYRNQDDLSPCTRPEMDGFDSHQDDHFNAMPEEVCSITIQRKSNQSSEDHSDVSIQHSSVLCQGGRSENASPYNFVLSPPLPEVEANEEPAQEMDVFEPVQIRIEDISSDGSTPMVTDDDEEQSFEIDSNQKYVYHPSFQAEDDSASGMQASDLDPHFQQHQEEMYGQPTETPGMPEHSPSRSQSFTDENSQIHGHEPMSHPMYDMPPDYNCWLDVNLQPLMQVRNIFIRQGAFAIKYGATTTIMTGVLHFNSVLESCLFESHFLPPAPPMPDQFVQHQHYPPPYFQSDRTMPQTGAEAEVDDEEETEVLRENRVNMKQQTDDDVDVDVMEMESSDEEDSDHDPVGRSSSHISPSRPSPTAREIFLKLQPVIRRMRKRLGRVAFSEKLKKYLTHRHLQRMGFLRTVNFCKPAKEARMPIRLRSDLIAKETWHEEKYERQLEESNRVFIYELHFRNYSTPAYVVHDGVDFLCPDCDFLNEYIRYMLGLSRVKEDPTIEEIKTLDN